jgi:hypothetical protein
MISWGSEPLEAVSASGFAWIRGGMGREYGEELGDDQRVAILSTGRVVRSPIDAPRLGFVGRPRKAGKETKGAAGPGKAAPSVRRYLFQPSSLRMKSTKAPSARILEENCPENLCRGR